MENMFTKHPQEVGETYWQHCWFALRFGTRMLLGGTALIIHGFLPFCFVETGKRTVEKLSKVIQCRHFDDTSNADVGMSSEDE